MDREKSFEMENVYRSIFENAVEGIFQSTPQGRYLKVNPSLAQMYGYASPDEMLQKLSDIGSQLYVEPKRREEFKIKMELSGFVRDFQSEVFRANGSQIWISENVRSIRNSAGIILYYEGFVTDITALQRSRDEVKEREAVLKTILRTVPVGIGMTFNRILRQVNDRLPAMLGYAPEQLIGKSVRMLYAREEEFQKVGHMKELQIIENETETLETTWRKSDGTAMDILLSFTRIDHPRFNKGNIFAAMDVTEGKATEKKRAQLEKQVRHFQKMESLGTLAGGIAHDFNNILVPIMGFTELTLDYLAEGSREMNHLKQVMEACRRAKHLVEQILIFSRQSKAEKKPVQIKLVVKEALALLRALIPNSIEIRENFASDALISADPNQIHQVVMNLCMNAIHAVAGKPDGIIEIGLIENAPRSLSSSEPTGRVIELSVRDNGHGIPPKTAERLFEPFFTTKGKGEGSGLGLAVVHGIVQSHNGRIEIESQPDQGAVFRIFLPIIEETRLEAENPKISVCGGEECILFVDDEPTIATVMQLMLKRIGYRVVCRTDSTDALTLFKSQPARFDAVITDMSMPGLTGLQLTNKILKTRPDMPIVLCTGCAESSLFQEARTAGIRGFLRKPVRAHELAAVLRGALGDAPVAGLEASSMMDPNQN